MLPPRMNLISLGLGLLGLGTVACTQEMPVDEGPRCGEGTELVGDRCVGRPLCGPGTSAEENRCVAEPLRCGPGTRAQGKICIPDEGGGGYEIRLGAPALSADGYHEMPVLVLGPALGDELVLAPSSLAAGTLRPARFALGGLGVTSFFTACSAALFPGCAGTLRLQLMRADAPANVLAESSELSLVPPEPVGSPAPCQGGGNLLHLDGEATDPVHPGKETIALKSYLALVYGAPKPSIVELEVGFKEPRTGSYDISFSSHRTGLPLFTQVYPRAQSYPFTLPLRPGLTVGRRCDTVDGAFQVHELRFEDNKLRTLTMTFEQRCNGLGLLRGCVRLVEGGMP